MDRCKVEVSPNPIKTKVRINLAGQEIDPNTKRILKKDENSYVPSPEQISAAIDKNKKAAPASVNPVPEKSSDSLTEIIDILARRKVESITKLVDDRVVEILKESIK